MNNMNNLNNMNNMNNMNTINNTNNMNNFEILGDIIKDLLEKTGNIKHPNAQNLIFLLKKQCYTPYDLIKLDEYKEDFENSIGDLLDIIERDILDLVGTGSFAKELDKLIPLLKRKKDIDVIKRIKYFLEHEEEDEYDLELTSKLIVILPKINNGDLQKICLLLIQKINSLLILPD